MILIFLALITLASLSYWRKYQHNFEKKPLKDVIVKDDVKAYLNLPHKKASFSHTLEKTQFQDENKTNLLKVFNETQR